MSRPLPIAQKLSAVRAVRALLAGGAHSQRSACAAAGVPQASYQLWSRTLDTEGEAGLRPDYSACGRPPKFELTSEEQQELRQTVLVHDSIAFAIEVFARTAGTCRHEIREAILAELDQAAKERRYARWPMSVKRAASTTLEDRARFRGERAFQSISFSPRKGLFFVDENGNQIKLEPHVVWVMDDYSTNQPYIIDGGEDQAHRLCRQVLASMDVFSDAWLSVEMIGRERDAYRAEDIVRFILRTVEAQGTLPLYLLLERGRWDSAGVHGLDLGCLGAKYEGRKWGALDDLFGIIHGFSSRHKAMLESSFNILQRALAHSGTDIGRVRGEFERATRDALAVQAGRRDPHTAGFLTQDASRECHWQAMQYLNGRGKHRAATGTVEIPNDLLELIEDTHRRPLRAEDRWRFLPIKRKATVRAGFVELSVSPYRQPFRFQINGIAGLEHHLPTGYTLLVAFDPALPAMGAHIANGETGALNRSSWPIGHPLFTAPNAQDVPQFDLRSGGYGDSNKRRANTAARTAFAAINPYGKRGLTHTQSHDGQGNASIHRTGAAGPESGSVPLAQPDGETARGERGRQVSLSPEPLRKSVEEMEEAALEALG